MMNYKSILNPKTNTETEATTDKKETFTADSIYTKVTAEKTETKVSYTTTSVLSKTAAESK